MLAVGNDDELDKMLSGVTIPQGGVMPKIHAQLLPKKTKNSTNKTQANGSSNALSQEYWGTITKQDQEARKDSFAFVKKII